MYRKHILSQPIAITEIYWSLPEHATLLCYEQPGQNCHRRIVADMIFEEMGFTIPEYDPRDIEGIHSEIEFM